jgi:hypothetical protein
MSEIQSAEEFVKFIDNNYINLGVITKQTMADLIRSRDKAIVERILEKVRTITTGKEMSGEASWGWMEARFCAEESIKSVLRDLGIE